MTQIPSFHEVRFPTDLALGATGGPERRTEIVTLGSGHEQRNTRWVNSRRRYNAGYGIKTIDDLYDVIGFFEERRGRLFGFRFRDPMDYKSTRHKLTITANDQLLGEGDGQQTSFQLVKTYGANDTGYTRKIIKPVDGTVKIAVTGVELSSSQYAIDIASGMVQFDSANVPESGAVITAGYEFDVPVRFDSDEILVNLRTFEAGDIPSIPLVELRS